MNVGPDEHSAGIKRRTLLLAGSGAGLLGLAHVASAGEASAEGARLHLAEDGRTRYQVYCGADEDATVLYAANELASYLKSITSATFPVVSGDTPPSGPPLLVVGRNNPLSARLPKSVDYAALGEDGFALRAVAETVFIAGANPRGTLYGVTWLLDHVLGVRWFSADYTRIPAQRTLKVARESLNTDEVPRFRYRQIYAGDSIDPAYRHHNLLNGNRGFENHPVPKHLDTWSTYWPADPFGGNWQEMVPDESLWYGGQVLAMDPRTREMATDNLVKKLRERIAAGLDPSWGFEQADRGWDPDPASKEFASRHGGALSAAVVDLANDVAARVRQQIPEARLSTQAYSFSFSPPTGIHVGEGVVMTVAPIQANFAHSRFEGDNAEIGQTLKKWCEVADDIVIWDYTVDFAYYIQPFPDYWSFGATVQGLAEHPQVGGYFAQNAYNAAGTEFAELRTWVLGRLLWDPSLDPDALIREFLRGYYGPAAQTIYSYMKLMRQSVEDTNTRLVYNATVNSPYLHFDTMLQADKLMAKAEELVRNNPDLRAHVQAVRLCVDFVILMRAAEFVRIAKLRGLQWDPDLENRLPRFEEEVRVAGLTRSGEFGMTPEQLIRQLRIASAPATPPATAAGLPLEDWVDFQEPALKLYGPVTTILDDPDASNGYTVRMPGNRPDWGVQLTLDGLPTEGTWKVYISVRADTGSAAPEATAMAAGVWPPFGNERTITVSEVSDGSYHELELPGTYRYDAENIEYVWVSPPNSAEIPYVYVDRIFAVRV
ncbi:DUF4838 domain-containing protein [Actinopolymorpha singaporensis]